MRKPGGSFKCHMVSWNEAYLLAKILVRKIKSSGFMPDLVIGIARGGLVPARVICDFLHQKDLLTIKVEHWGTAATIGIAKIKFSLPIDANISGKKILIVDDVADTGNTCYVILDYLKEKNPAEIRIATLHYKTNSRYIPDYWSEKQDTWKWIIYPWAVYEDLIEFIEKVLTRPMTPADIRKDLKNNFDIKIPRNDLLEALEDMLLAGKLKRCKKGRKIFWEHIMIT